jgi:hypothetical protein
MKKNFLLTLLSFLIFFCTDLTAQRRGETSKPPKKENEKPKKEKSKKGESKDVEVFDQGDDYDYFEKKNSDNPKNVFKINPLEALDGTFPIYFERVLNNKFSLEVGIGLTTTSSWSSSISSELFGSNDYDGFYKGKTGLMFKFGARYYAGRNDDAPEGTYFALEYQAKNFKFDAYPYINGSRASSGPYQETNVSNTDLVRILFGYQSEGSSSNFVWDPYIGIGWRKHNFEGWYQEDNKPAPTLGSVSEYKPVFLIGFKMGIRF